MEQVLEIKRNGKFNNITLKTRYQYSNGKFVLKEGKKVILDKGLEDNNFVIVTKHQFADGSPVNKGTYTFFNCKVMYNEEEVSFALYEKEHIKYSATGGVGDSVKITLKKELSTNAKTGVEQMFENLYFEKI